MLPVFVTGKDEHGDCLVYGIDDPVFGYARLCVVEALLDELPVGVLGTDHLHDQVRAEPVFVPAARVIDVADQQRIRLAELAVADPHT